MANPDRTWFLAPGLDLGPSAIKLGSVVYIPEKPQELLDATLAEKIPKTIATEVEAPRTSIRVPDLDIEIHKSRKTRHEQIIGRARAHSWSVFAEFSQWVVDIRSKFSRESSQDTETVYEFDELYTHWFNPTPAFRKAALAPEAVQTYLNQSGRSTRLYIVTGTKVVFGATVSTRQTNSKGHDAQLGTNAPTPGGQVSVGISDTDTKSGRQGVGWKDAGPFCFAYQVQQVRFKHKKLVGKQYTKGAAFGLRADDDKDFDSSTTEAATFLGEESDFEFLEPKEAIDDESGEPCYVVIPLIPDSE